MKSFLDRLRRKSGKTPVQKTGAPSPSPEPTAAEKAPEAKDSPTAPGSDAPPGALTPLPAPAPAAAAPAEAAKGHSIELQIGDFLDRIPPAVLKEGIIDRTLPLRFDLSTLARQFTRSQPTIPLSEIFKRQPGIFCRELAELCGAPILLPWQKIVDMVQSGKGDASALPPEVLSALTRSLHEQRAAYAKRTSLKGQNGGPGDQNSARRQTDPSAPSWFSPKSMPGGALTTLPSTLRPPPTAAESLRRSNAASRPSPQAVPLPQNGSAPHAPAETTEAMPPAPPPPRPSVLLGEQLAKITSHFDRLVQQLDETAKAQAPVRSQHLPGLELLIQTADKKVSQATQERDAMVDLKSHLDSQFEALSFAQSGIATLQETIEAQSGEFTRMQQVLQSVEEQLAAMTSERDALAEAKTQLAEEIGRLNAGKDPLQDDAARRERDTLADENAKLRVAQGATEDATLIETGLRNRISELQAQLAHQQPAAPVLARISAARALAHRAGSQPAGAHPAKSRPIHWPAYLNTLNAQRQTQSGRA